MPLFAVLPVVQQTHLPQSPHSHNPVQNAKDPLAPLSTPMVGKSSQHRTANTTPPPSHAALSAAALSGTPHSHGSGSRTLRDDPTRVVQNLCKHYDDFLAEDLAHNRVYISFGDALENILHVPCGWGHETHEYHKIIEAVSKHPNFILKRNAYLDACDVEGSIEPSLYVPQALLYNEAIALINKFSDKKPKEDLLHFQVNHPQRITKGIFTAGTGLSPDLTCILRPLEKEKSFIWPMIVHVEEMKCTDATLDTGENAPRVKDKKLKVHDPLSKRYSPARAKSSKEPEAEAGSTSNKRKMPTTRSVPSKSARTSQRSSPSTRTAEASAKPDNKTSTETRLQCARYLMEMLEHSILRSHAFLTLVDRDQLQLMYADRSVIVTSSIVDLRTNGGLKMFLAMLIAFHRLTPQQWGFLSLVENPFPTTPHNAPTPDKHKWLEGLTMQLQLKGSQTGVCLTLGKVLYNQPGIIGRGTCVVEAKVEAECKAPPEEWKNTELVVKVSWPGITRQSEIKLLGGARDEAARLLEERKGRREVLKKEADELRQRGNIYAAEEKDDLALKLVEEDETHWALKHLPNILHSQDLDLDSAAVPMPQTKLAILLNNAEYINGSFKYEVRTARTTVQEKLQNLVDLTPFQCAQAFYDVLLCHRWLHEQPQILHRDISAGNIMCRIVKDKVYGVLNDLDLSSLQEDVKKGHATSFQRTGTPPYMAIELLQDTRTATPPVLHLYRHDLEALTYVILMHCSRYKFDPVAKLIKRRDDSPFDEWFDPELTWTSLSEKKHTFVTQGASIDKYIHPTFRAFVPWLNTLLTAFQDGFHAKVEHRKAMDRYHKSLEPAEPEESDSFADIVLGAEEPDSRTDITKPSPFDNETLGGHVQFTKIARSFLTVRFDGVRLELRSKGT